MSRKRGRPYGSDHSLHRVMAAVAFDRFCLRQEKRLRLTLGLDVIDLEDARDADLRHYSLPPGDGMERVHMEHETLCEVRR